MRVKISDIAEIQIGYQFREKIDQAADGTHQVIQVKDIDELRDHQLIPSSLYRVTPDRDSSKYEVSNGDVIFLSKGRRNYATHIAGLFDMKTIVPGYFFILKIKNSGILPEFLTWSINQHPAQSYLQTVTRGTGIPFIRKDDFSELTIHIPNLDIQRKIVELHKLSLKESALLHQLRMRREELIRTICINSTKQENSQGESNGEK